VLEGKVRGWLQAATTAHRGHVRAVIAPHAGYAYCGHVMAYAYKYINPALV
jgi:AmmeMemoRadiSam system protein B